MEISEIFVSPDPIGRHIEALRIFYRDLVDHEKKLKLKKCLDPVPVMPKYPIDYPTHDFLRSLRTNRDRTIPRLEFRSRYTKNEIDDIWTFTIKRILLQIGFHVESMENNDKALARLSQEADEFLQNFVKFMRLQKDSEICSESQDLWNPLEMTLRKIRYKGIYGIAQYFYGEFVKMDEALYNDCIKKLQTIIEKPSNEKENQEDQNLPNSSSSDK